MKKVLAIILAIALLCIIAVGTTLSYFKDEAYDINTMSVGNVKIEQYEKDRSGNAIDNDGLKLYPVTSGLVDGLIPVANNGVDKVVTVKNTGSENAYVRTIFAFELKNDGKSPIDNEVMLVQSGITMTNVTFTKDGVQYIIGVCNYGLLKAGETTVPSLKQVYLASTVGNEFYDAVGNSYNILVLSQAVQTQGFADAATALNTAFGEVTTANVTGWFANR